MQKRNSPPKIVDYTLRTMANESHFVDVDSVAARRKLRLHPRPLSLLKLT